MLCVRRQYIKDYLLEARKWVLVHGHVDSWILNLTCSPEFDLKAALPHNEPAASFGLRTSGILRRACSSVDVVRD